MGQGYIGSTGMFVSLVVNVIDLSQHNVVALFLLHPVFLWSRTHQDHSDGVCGDSVKWTIVLFKAGRARCCHLDCDSYLCDKILYSSEASVEAAKDFYMFICNFCYSLCCSKRMWLGTCKSLSGFNRNHTGNPLRSGFNRNHTGNPLRSGFNRNHTGNPLRSGFNRNHTGNPLRSGLLPTINQVLCKQEIRGFP